VPVEGEALAAAAHTDKPYALLKKTPVSFENGA